MAEQLDNSQGSTAGLKARALRGGAYIVVRQGFGMVLSLIGVLFVTRVIGPTEYGVFAATSGIVTFIATVGTWGIDVYLIRKPQQLEKREYDLGFTLLLVIGAVFATAVVLGHKLICGAIHMPGASGITMALALYIPTNLLALPGIVQLDRELRFKSVAYNELISQALNYVVGVPLALAGAGAWAPASGLLTQQVALLVLTYISTGFRPSLVWDRKLVREMLGYGLSYSSSIWVWQLRTLVNPVLVGRFAGAAAVGNVALAMRIVAVLSFARSATWRVAMAALAKLGESRDKLRKSIEEGMRLQALTVGLPLAVFALLAPYVIPPIFGTRWNLALQVFPFIAIATLANCIFNLHSSVLYLLQKNMDVTWFHVVHVAMFALATILFVPPYGAIGYGFAEILAIGSYIVIHVMTVRLVRSPSYASSALWFVVAAFAVLVADRAEYLRVLAAVMLVIPFLIPRERCEMVGYARLLITGKSA